MNNIIYTCQHCLLLLKVCFDEKLPTDMKESFETRRENLRVARNIINTTQNGRIYLTMDKKVQYRVQYLIKIESKIRKETAGC